MKCGGGVGDEYPLMRQYLIDVSTGRSQRSRQPEILRRAESNLPRTNDNCYRARPGGRPAGRFLTATPTAICRLAAVL